MASNSRRFGLTGVAGFVAPRHLKAIKGIGGNLVCVLDPHSSVGVLDQYGFSDTEYYSEPERFDRKLSRLWSRDQGINILSVCSPNYLHDAHCRMGLDNGADVICEKPLVIKPDNLSDLEAHERRSGRRVWTVLQMRRHSESERMQATCRKDRHHVQLEYYTPRGKWYHFTWKGDPERSGGLITNVGVHFLDLLMYVFGPCSTFTVLERTPEIVVGHLDLERATVDWRLSIQHTDPKRSCLVDGENFDFTTGFDGLHTIVYQEILAGHGYGITDARPSIELAWAIQHAEVGRTIKMTG